MSKIVTAGELEKDILIDAVTRMNDWLCEAGISPVYAVAAMKHLCALEEERSGLIVERVDWTKVKKQ